MKIRVAVYSRTRNFWGGSFQYAKAVTEALGGLDREKYEIRVWHEDDEEWKNVCRANGFADYVIDDYAIPASMLPAVEKILQTLKTLPAEAAAEREALLGQLRPFSTEAALDQYDPQILLCPQMGCPRYHKGAKHIGVIHDLMHRYEKRFPEVGTPEEVAGREHLFQGITNLCDAILVDSKVGMRHVLECYPRTRPGQIKVLPFTAFPEITQANPRRPDFALPEKFLFYPAQFWLHKNHIALAKAVALLKENHPDIAIVAAGNTRQNGYAPFIKIVEEEGLSKHFILPGYIAAEEINWLYRHARGFVMPTYFGPTNIPPLEAMALGCPVAVSGVYGMPEQCGDAALYFNPARPEELADVLARLWTDDALCAKLRVRGLERSKWYNEKAFGKRIRKIVEDVARQVDTAGMQG